MSTQSVEDRMARMFARSTDATLAQSLRTLAALPNTFEHAWSERQINAELERRHPEADERITAVFDELADDADVDYTSVLLNALGL